MVQMTYTSVHGYYCSILVPSIFAGYRELINHYIKKQAYSRWHFKQWLRTVKFHTGAKLVHEYTKKG